MTKPTLQNVHGVDEFFVEYFSEADTKGDSDAHETRRAIRSNIPAFASTVQKTKSWIAQLMQEMQWDDARKAYHGLEAVLHALRDRLTIKEAADLSAQLPMLIRGMYFEGWQPNHVPVKDRNKQDFLAHVAAVFPDDLMVDPELVCRAVFHVMRIHVSEGEMEDIEAILPKPLRDWFHAL